MNKKIHAAELTCKETDDADQIIVDDVEPSVEEQQRNGDMSVGGELSVLLFSFFFF